MSVQHRSLNGMASRLEDYIEQGRALAADEREIAALALQHVDESEQAEVDAAWEETVGRRLEELASENVEAVSGLETRAMGRVLLGERRR